LGERLGEGLPAVTQHQRNLSPDPFRVLNDMVRPETQDTPAFALHRGGAALVWFDLRSMMVAVDLDHELSPILSPSSSMPCC
jgi:hypothetical protein